MLYLSSILIDEKDIETFDELLEVIKVRAKDGEIFIKIDLKPPFPDTPENWEDKIESAFSSYIK
ncbi:sulfur relay protein DsrC [Gammaproteobacteria bacterium]|nr:sulfur relay protein DsrC [Gammaproteobacteria bacterium]